MLKIKHDIKELLMYTTTCKHVNMYKRKQKYATLYVFLGLNSLPGRFPVFKATVTSGTLRSCAVSKKLKIRSSIKRIP